MVERITPSPAPSTSCSSLTKLSHSVAAPGAGQPGAGTSPCLPGHVYAAGGAGGEAEGGGEAVTGGNELHDCQEEGLGGRGQHRRESQ